MDKVQSMNDVVRLLELLKATQINKSRPIMICDGSIINLKVLSSVFKKLEYTELSLINNPGDMIEKIMESSSDNHIIVYNLNDPNLNGIELIQELSNLNLLNNKKFLMMMPKRNIKLENYIQQLAEVVILVKPISADKLLHAMEVIHSPN